MKKLLLTIFAACFSFAVFGQLLLDDFDGNQLSGINITKWATFDPEVIVNPLMEGLNTSSNVISFPAHDFYAYYMNLGGLLGFQNIPAENFNDYNYVRFKYLAQDTTIASDTVKIQLKLEKGTEAHIYSDWLTIPIPEGTVNEWEVGTIAIPRNADSSPITHTMLSIIVSANVKSPVPFYFDDITFLVDNINSGKSLSLENRMTVYQTASLLKIKFDKAMDIKNVQVYSMTGALVISHNFGYSASEVSIPAGMVKGCYIIRVNSAEQILNQKFIKH